MVVKVAVVVAAPMDQEAVGSGDAGNAFYNGYDAYTAIGPYGDSGGDGGSNTGGGGGGSSHNGSQDDVYSGAGGSGIVIFRYIIGQTQTGTAKATGGLISYAGGKAIHTFLSSGVFHNPTSISNVEYLMVAGGGGGGGTSGGGGGGVIYQTGVTLPASPRNVVVGAGV